MGFSRSAGLSLTAITVLLLSLSIGAIAAHFWISDHRAVLRAVYPLETRIMGLHTECSASGQAWMKDLIRYIGNSAGGGASQIAYIDPLGKLHHCERGWTGAIFTSAKVSPNSRFRYASTTKLITADAVLSLVRDGNVQFDTTLAQLFPDLLPFTDPRLEVVTINMLLMHMGGFDRTIFSDPMFTLGREPWCPLEMNKLAELQLHFEPGSSYAYSNLGYCILGAVVERLTGESYRDFVSKKYELPKRGIRFVDGSYLPDEVRYDFRFDAFYSDAYLGMFDFYSVSSSAGLSGSATALALLIRDLIEGGQPNLLSGVAMDGCDTQEKSKCYAYSFYRYQHPASGKTFFVQEGYFPGSSSIVFVNDQKEILVVLGAGAVPVGLRESKAFYDRAINSFLKGSAQ